jgi:hypothetical protein
MNTYTFSAFGKTKTVKADSPFKAMAIANWKFPLGAGLWENGSTSTSFKWIAGNFFN